MFSGLAKASNAATKCAKKARSEQHCYSTYSTPLEFEFELGPSWVASCHLNSTTVSTKQEATVAAAAHAAEREGECEMSGQRT